ncbi:MmgE/PrpD family protein [Euzebya pacifica]|uniref:MmgE/PrpD family protein n=1 Tax=Euzebya pacifica TaxID=1608957 RepID=UPI0030F6FB65
MIDTLAAQLSEFAVATMQRGAPPDVRASVRDRILDVLGLQAAALPLGTSHAVLEFVTAQGGSGDAHVTGLPQALPASWAAFAGGALAHSLDYDDTHLPSVLHPSASVVPAALAVAEANGADGVALVNAVAVGIEVVVRLGMAGYDLASRNSIFFEHGQHATSICGTLGAAVAASLLQGGTADDVRNAIGVSASMASGIIEANRTGGTVKRIHCGWAAHAGVTAASLVEHGLTGAPTSLEGRFGFFQAFLHGAGDLSQISDGLGEVWAVPGIFFKPYPANHFTHGGIDAARRLRADGVTPNDVESLVLGVAAPTVRTIGEPIDVKRSPPTGYQAQFSGPYTVAAALIGGSGLGLGLEDFADDLVAEPARRDLMNKVSVVADERCDEIFPFQFPAILTASLRDGSTITEEVLVNRGGPDDPLSAGELAVKFAENVGRSYGEDLGDEVVSGVQDLESLRDIGNLCTTFARPRS